jgi:hypothetical protein
MQVCNKVVIEPIYKLLMFGRTDYVYSLLSGYVLKTTFHSALALQALLANLRLKRWFVGH